MATEKSGFVTYQDIADRLGVTKMTVSKALRDSPDISPATKSAVKKVADELGYIPNVLAKNLKTPKADLIAVVFNSFQNPYFSSVCSKIMDVVDELEYPTQLFYCDMGMLDLTDAKKLMMNKYSGIISCVEPTEEAMEFLRSKNVPFVLIGIHSSVQGVDCVYTDDYAGGALVGKYCAENGYKKIMFASDSFSETSKRRCRGFVDELKKYGKEACVIESQPGVNMSALTAEKIRNEGFDFVFGFSDSFSILLRNLLGKTDACFFGFDNLNKYIPIIPQINSVEYDLKAIIDFSCKMLIDKMQGKISFDEKIEKVFPVTLCVKE